MPELPEIETIKRALATDIIGKTIENIEVLSVKQCKGDPKKGEGKKIINITRKGKVLTLHLSSNLYLSFHLMMSGQILFAENKDRAVFKNTIPHSKSNSMPIKSTRIILNFTDNSALYFNDQRKFGWLKISEFLEESTAVDILSPEFTFAYFKKSISSSKKPIKVLLLEQDKITGIGNIYDNDLLWEAKIHPARKADTLSESELETIYNATKKIIEEGILRKGSSAKDEMYVLPNSEKGTYQNFFKVYHREDLPCLRDGTPIQKIKLGGRGTYFCPKCQK